MDQPQENTADQFIEEVRERRRQVSEKFGNDVGRYFDELIRREKEHPERIAVPVRSGTARHSSTRSSEHP